MTNIKEFQEDLRDLIEAGLSYNIPAHVIIGLLEISKMALIRSVQDCVMEADDDEITEME